MSDGAGDPYDHEDMKLRDENARILWLTLLSVAIIFFVASLYPAQLFLAVFSGLLSLGAAATAFFAFVASQNPFGRTLTLWDKVALLTFLGLATGLLVDTSTVQAFLATHAPAPEAAPGLATTPPSN